MESKDTVFYSKKTLNIKGKVLSLADPVVMGILNITPDSFYDGGKYLEEKEILIRVEQMLQEGALFIDIGGYSSRPGAENISEEEERKRVVPAIKSILKRFPGTNITIDTFRGEIAKAAVLEGACLINDISGGTLDPNMFATVAELKVPYVLMHMRGTPQTMNKQTNYDNIVIELISYFEKKIKELEQLGLKDIIIDPGFGFAKTIEQNYELLRHLKYFRILNKPILAGLSRKSMVYKKLGIGVEEAGNGTTVLNTIALQNGASFLRVHDVKQTIEIIKLYKAVNH